MDKRKGDALWERHVEILLLVKTVLLHPLSLVNTARFREIEQCARCHADYQLVLYRKSHASLNSLLSTLTLMSVVLQSSARPDLSQPGGNQLDQIRLQPHQRRCATPWAMGTDICVRNQDVAMRCKCMFPSTLPAFQRKGRWAYWHVASGCLFVINDGVFQTRHPMQGRFTPAAHQT